MNKVLVFVYKCVAFGDCTSGGVTSKISHTNLFADCTEEEVLEYCKEKEINPEEQLILNRRVLWGEPHYYAEPVVTKRGNQMAGGNFVYTSDAAFEEITGSNRPLPVHDRFEAWT